MEKKRKERDLMKLRLSNYEVNVPNEQNLSEFYVNFSGPKESAYEGVRLVILLILGSVENSCYSSGELPI